MKKWKIAITIIGVLIVAGYLAYQYYLPKVIADAISSDDEVAIMPEKIQKKVRTLKAKVNQNIDMLPELMIESNINYDDIVTMIDLADPDQFFSAYDELKLNNWQTTDDVFEIGLKHISIEGYELEKFRSVFNSYASIERIKQALEIIEKNELLTSMSVPVAKETAKNVILSRKEEIEEKLK